ncbi:hypothetical protein JCM19294_2509 [Nonlabens tegetincola]|uniref:Uncharacterized protein n=1 Tax=Nonlabens tegetincola TaxID=323273 RepID=A0A090Q0L4_9FLAO|nr:hypothetical protein JCM19294_2509 [Nonlabens tegetincola]
MIVTRQVPRMGRFKRFYYAFAKAYSTPTILHSFKPIVHSL